MQLAVLDEKGIGARRFGNLAAPVEHQRIVIAAIFGRVLGHGADHVQARCLGLGGRGIGRGPAPGRNVEPEALADGILAEIAAPVPHRDGQMRLGQLRRNAHLLRAAPGDGSHIGIFECIGLQHVPARLIDLLDRPGELEAED